MNSFIQIISPTFAILAVLFTSFKWEGSNRKNSELQNKNMEVLVGTYTGKGSDGIYSLDFNPESGTLSNSHLLTDAKNPSFLTYDHRRRFVFAVNEGNEGMVSSFQWNHEQHSLNLISQQSSEGSSPCHLELNPEENLLAVANYGSGNISIYKVDDEGKIEANPTIFQHSGSGPVKPNQDGPRAHCVKFDLNGKFLYAVDLGIDQIVTYSVNGSKVGEQVSSVSMDPGDGPRHLIFHPNLDLAFAVNELGSSVVSMKLDHETGKLERVDKASTLPDDFAGKNYCADIHMTSNGKFLYASNRGHHSIAIFKVSDEGGLERIGIEPIKGEWPRNFTLSPDEKYILVANQNSNNITVFQIDDQTGLMKYTGNEFTLSQPVALRF